MTEEQKRARYGPVVAEVVSRRTGETYQIRQHPVTLKRSCQCRGWAIRKTCKHTQALTTVDADDQTILVHVADDGSTRVAAARRPDAHLDIVRTLALATLATIQPSIVERLSMDIVAALRAAGALSAAPVMTDSSVSVGARSRRILFVD